MSFLACCPHCQRETLAPDDDLGRSVACHGCRADFVLVPEFTAVPSPALWSPAGASFTEQPSCAERFEPSPLAVLERPAEIRAEAESVAFPDPGRPPRGDEPFGDGIGPGAWVLAGVACLCAALAGVSASVTGLTFLTVPLALGSLLLGGLVTARFVGRAAPPLELAVPGVPTAGSALLLLLALLAPDYLSPQFEASRQKPTDDAEAILYLPTGGELVDPATLVPADGWVDARRAGCQQGAVRIDVTAATVGPVELVGQKGVTKERYLTITLRIRHVGDGGPVAFVPWGATAPRAVPDAKLTVGGKTVGQTVAGGQAAAQRGELIPATAIVAKLVFDPPPPGAPLRLELPAEAWGRTGSFRFAIPAAMIAVATPPKPKAK